jgi:hypothetical protein
VWLRERARDGLQWPRNLVRDLPRRLVRLGQLARPEAGSIALNPERGIVTGWAVRLYHLLIYLFDLAGGPEVAQFAMHLAMETRPLTPAEIEAVSIVLGGRAIRYREVRIAEGGILPRVFQRNKGRAFCTWHTIHLPREGDHGGGELSLIVHESTHVYQYERLGTAYIGEALLAQRRLGRDAYRYGGADGLRDAGSSGATLAAYNREAQAQIAQDYYRRHMAGEDVSVYLPFIEALRAGLL